MDVVLLRIGAERLEQIADEAHLNCLTRCVSKAFRDWFSQEKRAKRMRTLEDFAAVFGWNKSTAHRYYHGQIQKTDFPSLDLYLHKIGTSLKKVLPEDHEVHREILEATLRALFEARALPAKLQSYVLPLDEDKHAAIVALVNECPLPKGAETNPNAWLTWVRRTMDYLAEKPLPVRLEEIGCAGYKKRSWLLSLALGDLQVARMYLPWQILSIVLVPFLEVVKDVLRMAPPPKEPRDERTLAIHTESLAFDGTFLERQVKLSSFLSHDEWLSAYEGEPVFLGGRPTGTTHGHHRAEFMCRLLKRKDMSPELQADVRGRFVLECRSLCIVDPDRKQAADSSRVAAVRYYAAALGRMAVRHVLDAALCARRSTLIPPADRLRVGDPYEWFRAVVTDVGAIRCKWEIPIPDWLTWEQVDQLARQLSGGHRQAVGEAIERYDRVLRQGRRSWARLLGYCFRQSETCAVGPGLQSVVLLADAWARKWGNSMITARSLFAALAPSDYIADTAAGHAKAEESVPGFEKLLKLTDELRRKLSAARFTGRSDAPSDASWEFGRAEFSSERSADRVVSRLLAEAGVTADRILSVTMQKAPDETQKPAGIISDDALSYRCGELALGPLLPLSQSGIDALKRARRESERRGDIEPDSLQLLIALLDEPGVCSLLEKFEMKPAFLTSKAEGSIGDYGIYRRISVKDHLAERLGFQ